MAHQKTQVGFPAPTSGSSQPPVTPTPENWTPSAGHEEHCTLVHKPTHWHTPLRLKKN